MVVGRYFVCWDVELPTFKNSMDYVSVQNVRERDTLVNT